MGSSENLVSLNRVQLLVQRKALLAGHATCLTSSEEKVKTSNQNASCYFMFILRQSQGSFVGRLHLNTAKTN